MPRSKESEKNAESVTVRLEIASRIAMMETADVLVNHLARVVGFDEGSIDDIRVAVDESVVNAITHGNRLDETKRVTLEVVLLPDALEVRIHDQGVGFDPASVADPLAAENLLRSGGRGILLMRSLMDEVRYSHSASGGTQMTLLKRVPRGMPARRGALLGQNCTGSPAGEHLRASGPAC
jgi:serine/threonine-protein kinase RsbW